MQESLSGRKKHVKINKTLEENFRIAEKFYTDIQGPKRKTPPDADYPLTCPLVVFGFE